MPGEFSLVVPVLCQDATALPLPGSSYCSETEAPWPRATQWPPGDRKWVINLGTQTSVGPPSLLGLGRQIMAWGDTAPTRTHPLPLLPSPLLCSSPNKVASTRLSLHPTPHISAAAISSPTTSHQESPSFPSLSGHRGGTKTARGCESLRGGVGL